ncbi:hypothetical protein GDO86_003005, partial [Hymenochirus boettgeri]
SSSKPRQCFLSSERKLEVEFETFAPLDITIKAKNVSSTPQIQFQKKMQDIPFFPSAPTILSLVPDFQTDTLRVEWSLDNSTFFNGVNVKCQINVSRSENPNYVNETNEVSQVWPSNENVFSWNWTSSFPLPCTSHSVRIRCLIDDPFYSGEKDWSDWSPLHTVNGATEQKMYPTDKVVAVGSNMTFCCSVSEGYSVISVDYGNDEYSLIRLGNNSSGIRVQNLNMSEESGINVICYITGDIIGTVVFVGYPPDTPQNFSCETKNLKQIECTWTTGQPTGLYGDRRTVFTLHERYSGRSYSPCEEETDQCIFICDITQGQNLYEFSLEAVNPLGRSKTSLAFNATHRIHPNAPSKVTIEDLSSTSIVLSWYLDGNFVSLQFLCEIELTKDRKGTEMRQATFFGTEGANYSMVVDSLRPFHQYGLRVRCATVNPFWKWSDWSAQKRHTTLEAAPSKNIDIWLEDSRNSEGQTVTVYWKHLPTAEANGKVINYTVSWRPIGSKLEPQSVDLGATFNRTQIHLDRGDNGDYEISVVAKNSAGSSPSSRITTVQLPSDDAIELAVGAANGINITWQVDVNASCGYLVQWKPSALTRVSAMKWRRFHPHATNSFIRSDQLPVGVRYNISVFACKEQEYQLLKKVIGYSGEL